MEKVSVTNKLIGILLKSTDSSEKEDYESIWMVRWIGFESKDSLLC